MDYGFRWYNPEIGRWNAVDPLAEKQLAHSPYHYVYGNPIKFFDPLGLEGISESDKDYIRLLQRKERAEDDSNIRENAMNERLSGLGTENCCPDGGPVKPDTNKQDVNISNPEATFPTLKDETMFSTAIVDGLAAGMAKSLGSYVQGRGYSAITVTYLEIG